MQFNPAPQAADMRGDDANRVATTPPDMNAMQAVMVQPADGQPATSASKPAAREGPGPSGFFERFSDAINGRLERAFAKLGSFVARRPILVIILSIIVALILSAGVLRLENETRGDRLWIPDGTQAKLDNVYVQDNYARFARLESMQFSKEGENILTPAAFNRALEVHQAAINTVWRDTEQVWNASSTPAAAYKYTDVCLNRFAGLGAEDPLGCFSSNVLELFSYNRTKWATSELLLATLNDETLWDRTLVSGGFVLSSFIGGIARDASEAIVTAKALSFTYLLYEDAWYIDEQEEYTLATGWEGAWLENMEAENVRAAEYEVTYFGGRSFDDEFGDSISSDVLLLQVAIAAIGIFTALQLSKCRDNCVGSRVVLTLMGLLAIGLAIGSTYGFCSAIGIIFSPLMTVLPFIMIGIGVDSIFILVGTFDNTDADLTIEERMAETLRTGGVSVTLAAFTNFFAFIIGSNTSLPALRAFSIYAAFGLLFDWMYQITFFAALLVIDARRQKGRRYDVACCAKSTAKPNRGVLCGACGDGVPEKPLLQRLMRKLGLALTFTPVRALVLLIGAGLFATGIYGTLQIKVDADVNDFIPTESYLRDYFDVSNEYFVTTGPQLDVYFRSEPDVIIDFSSPTTWAQMDEAVVIVQEDKYTVSESVDSWLTSLRAFDDGQGRVLSQASFYTDLQAFLATPFGSAYRGDIKYVNADVPSEGIKTCRIGATWVNLDNSRDEVAAMDSIRESLLALPAPIGTNAFAFGGNFLQYEQYKKVGEEALLNIGLGCLMVAVVIIILLAQPVASLLTFSSVIIVIVEVVGFMWAWGFNIDSVTVIFLVISIGLSVDYSVHVAHGYLSNHNADPDLRIITTMEDTGAAVINGAVSTFLAAVCLSGSGSYVFFTFFCALFLVVLFGMFQGLVVLPVLLGLIQPKAHYKRT